MGGDGGVCGEAAGVRVVSVHVARAGRVAGFDVEECVSVGSVKAAKHDVGSMLERCATAPAIN